MTPRISLLASVVKLIKAGADNSLGFFQLLNGIICGTLSIGDLRDSEAGDTLQQHIWLSRPGHNLVCAERCCRWPTEGLL